MKFAAFKKTGEANSSPGGGRSRSGGGRPQTSTDRLALALAGLRAQRGSHARQYRERAYGTSTDRLARRIATLRKQRASVPRNKDPGTSMRGPLLASLVAALLAAAVGTLSSLIADRGSVDACGTTYGCGSTSATAVTVGPPDSTANASGGVGLPGGVGHPSPGTGAPSSSHGSTSEYHYRYGLAQGYAIDLASHSATHGATSGTFTTQNFGWGGKDDQGGDTLSIRGFPESVTVLPSSAPNTRAACEDNPRANGDPSIDGLNPGDRFCVLPGGFDALVTVISNTSKPGRSKGILTIDVRVWS